MDDLQWIRDTIPTFRLEPMSVYYFEPNIEGDELTSFISKLDPIYNKNFYSILENWVNGGYSIKYFTTDSDPDEFNSWCDSTPIPDARRYHDDKTFINGRTLITQYK